MADEPNNAPDDANAPSPGWLPRLRGGLARSWQSLGGLLRGQLASRRRIVTLSVATLLVLLSGAATVWLIQSLGSGASASGMTLEQALDRLDAGNYGDARRLAAALGGSGAVEYGDLGGPYFVEGASMAYEAEAAIEDPRRCEQFLLAAKYLEQAQRHGFPHGREGEGLLLLGLSLQKSGRFSQSIPVLIELRQISPALASEADHLLAAAYLGDWPPQVDKAQQHAAAFHNGATSISPDQRQRGLLLQAEVALATLDLPACAAALEQIPAGSTREAHAQAMHGRLLLAQGDAARDQGATERTQACYHQAVETFRQATAQAPHDMETAPQASYFAGIALRRSGQTEAAQKQFAETANRYYNSPEGVLAGLEAAELLLEQGQYEDAEQTLVLTIRRAGARAQYANRWVPLDRFEERIEKAFGQLLTGQRHDLAVQLTYSMPPLLSADRARELRATAHERWAQHLEHQAATSPADERAAALARARRHYRQAGVDFARVAHLHYALRRYPDDLWRAGQNFNSGRDYQSAIIVLKAYLDTEAGNERPLVMVALGEALLSRDKADEAIDVLEDCLRDFPKDPASYRARLLASAAYVEHGDRGRAEELLLENLHIESLTPRSDAWRDSLFALGGLLYDDGRSEMTQYYLDREPNAPPGRSVTALELGHARLQDAVRRLSEAVQRYPDDPRATMAHYEIAEAHRHAARLPLLKLETEAIESRRLSLNRQAKQYLGDALESYNRLVADVMQRGDDGENSALDAVILRNAYFARGAVLYDLGRYEDAIDAYSDATSRYQHQPAVLEAYVQIAACYRRLNRPLDARGTLEQAKLVIERIDEDADFSVTSRFDRNEWIEHLNWMTSL